MEDSAASALSCGSHALGASSHHVMRTLKQSYGEVHMAVAPNKLSNDFSPGQCLDYNLMKDPKPESLKYAIPGFLIHSNCVR